MLKHRVPLPTDIPTEQREQLRTLVEAAAFEVPAGDTARKIVHCFGPAWYGSDWDLARVLAAIDSARCVRWTNDITGHDLMVSIDGEPYQFQVKRPEVAA